MLAMDVNVYPANHFHHSFVEELPLKRSDRVILLLGLDESRFQVKEVLKFHDEFGCPVEIYDACDYNLDGIHQDIQPLLAPIIVEAALKPMAEPLEAVSKPLDERKYMGKVPFWKDCPAIEGKLA